MNNKAGDPRAIVLIFAALAMALALIIFYIWLGVSGVGKQQSMVSGNVAAITIEKDLADYVTLHPDSFERSPENIKKELEAFFAKQYEGGANDFNCEREDRSIYDVKQVHIDCSFKVKMKKDTKNCRTNFFNYYLIDSELPRKLFFTVEVCT